MMIIAVASGKGGTGKTTVAVNLAVTWARQGRTVQLLDCDVEAPNVNLFVGGELGPPQPVTVPTVRVTDPFACTGCGVCADVCQFGAIACLGKRVVVFPELCNGCGGCVLIGQCGVLEEQDREVGTLREARSGPLTVVEGRLQIGERRPGSVIEQLRARAAPGAITIVDAPPGTSCAVVRALAGVDHVVLVTEPTPFGLHDLRQVVRLVRRFEISTSVVLNRADAGDDAVRQYCEDEGLRVVLEIPDDRRVAEAYARGQLIVDALPEHARLYERLGANLLGAVEEDA